MRKLFKIVLILALLSCAVVGLRQAQGQRDDKSISGRAKIVAGSRAHKNITVRVNDGSFVLKNLKLTKVSGSAILKGDVVNKTSHKQEQVSFEVRAYDGDGQTLKGLERENIFAVRELEANTSAPINQGYGVWLQGIPLEAIAGIEILETNEETASLPSWTNWFASHSISWGKDFEIEE
jgi:hypothetical protein